MIATGVKRVWLAAGLVVFVASLLQGCGEKRPIVDLAREAERKPSTPVVTAEPNETLRVAVGAMISPEITREYYQELMELVAKRVGRRVVFSQRRTYAEINELVRTHEVDLAFVCAGPYTQGHEAFGMELLVVPVVNGQKIYYSYILAHRDSTIQSFADLRGKRFAFTDPDSNSGCLVPTCRLALLGETPESYFAETFFTGSHDSSIKAVADGLVDAAAVHSLIWEFVNTVEPSDTARTRIVGKSSAFGIPPVVVHPDLDGDLKHRLKILLLSLHKDPQAIPLLQSLQIDRFEEGEDSMYDSVREMYQWLNASDREEAP
ncbi:MAG: phosphate/phosphite/phosphonate ABC transporter substrate-binding protein [Verrucomicrobia bacterium]|nr:phosphate/phosphite/phosphonate ABC transporter substrate-binding protein [Verrucomicrobiota bacterium]